MGSKQAMGSVVPGPANTPLAPRDAFRCRACYEPLDLVPDSHPLLFLCPQGHFYFLSELLADLATRGRAKLAEELAIWEERARTFTRLATWALKLGHSFMAADLQDAARRIQERCSSLRPHCAPKPSRTTPEA
jgi:hypothetical protein